jgi:acetolactate synthase-1/2/3 large subunit
MVSRCAGKLVEIDDITWHIGEQDLMPHMKGGKALVDSVLQYGVDTIFGLPGGQTYEVYDAIYAVKDKINLITTRNEDGAAYMAFGYARSSGKVGVFTVVPGPGFLNAATALSMAYACNTPVLCLSGQIPSHAIGRGIGYLHDTPDQLGIAERLTKWAARIDHPAQAPGRVREAFKHLQTGRIRPTSLEMPLDVMSQESEVEMLDPITDYGEPSPDPELTGKAAQLLGSARQPLIYVGSGAQDAGDEALELAEMLQAPVIAQRGGKGVISDRHYLSHSFPAGHRLWPQADVVLAVGTRLKYPRLHWGTDDELKLIHIDIDPVEIQRISTPTVGIVADAKAGLRALIDAVGPRNIRRPSREKELVSLKESMTQEFFDNVQPQMDYLRAIRDVLPDDGIFVDEITQVGFASWYGFPVYAPRTFISSGYSGNLGFGYPTSLGVKVANPDKKVVAIAGDGGFMFNMSELATAVKHRIATVTIIFNDSAFANVARAQTLRYGGRVIGTELCNPNFVKLAESFGASGYRAESPHRLREILRRGLEEDGPVIIEVPLPEKANPWQYLLLPRVRPRKPATA